MGGLDPATNPAIAGVSGGNQGVTQSASSAVDAASTRVEDAQPTGIFYRDFSEQTQVFAQEALALGEAAPDLVAELVDRYPGTPTAFASVEALQTQLDAGAITPLEFDASVAAIAGAYNDGTINFFEMSALLGFHQATQFYIAGTNEATTTFLDALDSAGAQPQFASEIAQFRENLANEVLGSEMPLSEWHMRPTSGAEIAVALEALAGNGPTAVAEHLSTLAPDQRTYVLENASEMGRASLNVEAQGGTTIGDPLELIVDSIIAGGYDSLALEVVQLAEANPRDFFDGVNAQPDRAQLMSDLFVNHSEYILDNLTLGSQLLLDDGVSTQLGQNLADLSTLLRMTAFNANNPGQSQALDALESFTNDIVAEFNELSLLGQPTAQQLGRRDELRQQIIGVAASAQDAFLGASADNQAAIESRQAVAEFLLDVVLTAAPLPSRAEEGIAGALSDALGGDNPAVRSAVERVLSDLTENVVDGVTDRLTEEARDALVDALGSEAAVVAELFSDTNRFIADTILSAVFVDNEIAGDARDVIRQIAESQ